MHRRGYVTVYLTLVLLVLLMIIMVVLNISDKRMAHTKVVTATSSVLSSELANYNRFIFDRYHILLLDKNNAGLGEASMEEDMMSLLSFNLGDEYQVNDIEISGTRGVLDDEYSEFKRQIRENFAYDAIDMSVDKLMDKTSGADNPVSDETISAMDNDIESSTISEEDDSSEGGAEGDEEKRIGVIEEEENEEVTDPRDTLETFLDAGLEGLMLPEDVILSEEVISDTSLPSQGQGKNFSKVETDFQDLDQMKMDLSLEDGWSAELLTNGEALIYANKYFSSLTDEKYSDTYLRLEMEYLVAGKESDNANFRIVVDKLLAMRFATAFAYIVTDTSKMSECDSLALALTVEAPELQPVVKYLLAGCWSFIESIADVYLLVHGHNVSFIKSSVSWHTDLESLGDFDSVLDDSNSDEGGMSYAEYLTLLLAVEGDRVYPRMLDLIQLNVNRHGNETGDIGDGSFKMENAITAMGVNVTVTYKSEEIKYHEEGGY